MTPWELVKRSEHSHQRALFAWANCAALYGFEVANDPRGYSLEVRNAWLSVCPDNLIPPIVAPVPVLSRLFAIHNQGHGDAVRGAQAKAEGIKAGVPDIMLPVVTFRAPGGYSHGLFIELKRPKLAATAKGVTSNDQKDWIAFLTGQGYRCEVCIGWEAARDVIKDYLQ